MKEIEFEGATHEFPDDFTDADIAKALGGGRPSGAPSMGQQFSKFLGDTKAKVQTGINYIDTLGGKLPGTPSGAFIPPASVNPVPGSLTEGLMSNAVPLGGKFLGGGALGRLTGGLVGGVTGSVMEGKNPVSKEGALTIAAPLALGEVAGYAGPRVAQMFPGVKSAISESNARGLHGTLADIDPDIGRVIERTRVEPTLRGGTTAAKIQQAIKSGDIQKTASTSMERDVGAVNMLSGSPRYNASLDAGMLAASRTKAPALLQAYESMPQLAKEQMVGPVDPRGFTLQQAQAIRTWVADPAFSQSPQGQGVGKVPQQKLVGQMTGEIERGLSPVAMPLWKQANARYSGTMGARDALDDQNAFQGLPNRILLNRNQLSDYLAQNREDLTDRLGPQGYNAFVQRVLGGAQPGTRDVLTPGGGGVTDAFMQTFGRGQGGSPQLLGAPLRTVFPNLGSQYTGRRPFSLPPQLQELFDVMAQRQAGQTFGQGPGQ